MGLRLRGDNWYLRKNVDGKRQEIALGIGGGEAGRSQAEKAAAKLAKQLNEAHVGVKAMRKLGVVIPGPKQGVPTFEEWAETYKATYTSQKAKGTQARDGFIISAWLSIFGDKRLDTIKQADCLQGLATRRKANTGHALRKVRTKLTEGSVQRERRLLQAMFERAVENDLLDKNPWKGIKGKPDVARHRLLMEADEAKLIAALEAERQDATGQTVMMNPRWVRLVTFLLQTGLRIDECLTGLVDNGRFINVTGKFGKKRDVPLTAAARKVLDDQIKADGGLWAVTQQRVREVLELAASRAGITKVSPHDLRHTFGHRWLQRGGDIYTLSKILGHASVAVTEKHYAYLLKEDLGTKMLAVMEGTPETTKGR